MNHPDWQGFALERAMLRDSTVEKDRLVLWLPTERDASFQYWERVANIPRGDIAVDGGLCITAATSTRARQRVGGLVSQIWNRLRQSSRSRYFLLPDGGSVEQCGERQNDLILVWSEEKERFPDQAQLEALWPAAKRFLKLGERLFLVSGLDSLVGGRAADSARAATQVPSGDNPKSHAEAILAAARQAGARDKEATALTDLAVIALNQGNAKGAIESLERALAITRELGDTAREGDVVGNLGMALLAVRQPERARELFERALDHARTNNDRFAEKVALERLGIASWNLRAFRGAFGFFDQALVLARQLGDRQQEANLLWHQGIQHAELGERERAITRAEESVALLSTLGRPQAASYGAYLQKYRMGLVDQSPPAPATPGVMVEHSPPDYLGGSIVASVMADSSSAAVPSTKVTGGPGLLRMAMSATKAMAGFAGSGFKTTPAAIQQKRLQTCAVCEHHTGVRCQICGCFTNAKSRMLHEACPIGKWPA
jgi:tetratricopeptide (TPR) repeat protein